MAFLAAACAHAHPPHVHGEASLNIVRDGASLLFWLRAPRVDITGFEHAPATPAEREATRQAAAFLNEPTRWIRLDETGGCAVRTIDVRLGLGEEPGSAPDASRLARPATNRSEQVGHGDVEATYRFECRSPLSMRGVDIALMTAYPSLQQIKVNIVSDDWQGSVLLKPGSERVHFSR